MDGWRKPRRLPCGVRVACGLHGGGARSARREKASRLCAWEDQLVCRASQGHPVCLWWWDPHVVYPVARPGLVPYLDVHSLLSRPGPSFVLGPHPLDLHARPLPGSPPMLAPPGWCLPTMPSASGCCHSVPPTSGGFGGVLKQSAFGQGVVPGEGKRASHKFPCCTRSLLNSHYYDAVTDNLHITSLLYKLA